MLTNFLKNNLVKTNVLRDIEVIENLVFNNLSNGFVEGMNSKLKMTKRTMYGRCNQKLIVAKLMLRQKEQIRKNH